MQKNVLGGDLESYNGQPAIKLYRHGRYETDGHALGMHVVSARVMHEFLEFSRRKGVI